jgi:hypothetical protein
VIDTDLGPVYVGTAGTIRYAITNNEVIWGLDARRDRSLTVTHRTPVRRRERSDGPDRPGQRQSGPSSRQ